MRTAAYLVDGSVGEMRGVACFWCEFCVVFAVLEAVGRGFCELFGVF